MQVSPLAIDGAHVFTPAQHGDARGTFLEWYRADLLAQVSGRPFRPVQANHSVSSRGVVRGVHFADVPPGQAKYVYCPQGAVLDVVVDLRVGSPTFGAFDTVELDEVSRRAVFLPEGLGHAFCALSERASVTYLVSSFYDPDHEHGVHPLDPDLSLPWPSGAEITLSSKDSASPSLADALAGGLLPTLAVCQALDSRERGA